ncbi:hypothetical protein [Flavobacterium aquatile]|uniref:Uncharacterized protein n=1 Tax=Flavobacterium aquatile LMG 4008 = ATCC 11947 TaxID=1453498 RepID=A0A095UXD3_9FLAO|nr:hypothetical protein [Flavobacterium aquatile]KGD67225.1 hypothetical protein LG45_13445 [Flavobacterium aquatile LMG 4008 = ATCC 11947]OXA66623.1 hypothetical protein B0A61_10460 [Flavobacterium aquatile LMG 4008 = ATCC 11947]GEC78604.1 hypothetical protein FAQ01_14740 [Flavobacterium aquatile]
MKTTILTLAIVALSFSNINAKEVTSTSNTIETTSTLTRDQITEVYDWNVRTNQGNYSGTANSLEEAKRMIELSSIGEIVLDRKIESFFQVKETVSSNTVRLYFWEVTTNSGTAKGFSSSESQAKRMIELVSTGDILNYKIIQSADFEK